MFNIVNMFFALFLIIMWIWDIKIYKKIKDNEEYSNKNAWWV